MKSDDDVVKIVQALVGVGIRAALSDGVFALSVVIGRQLGHDDVLGSYKQLGRKFLILMEYTWGET